MRKAYAVIKLSRVVYLYKSNARDHSALVVRMKEVTQTRVHYGYRRVYVMIRCEVFRDNHKLMYSVYREQASHCYKSAQSATRQFSLDSLSS
jgi:putative transposase